MPREWCLCFRTFYWCLHCGRRLAVSLSLTVSVFKSQSQHKGIDYDQDLGGLTDEM